MTSVGSTTKSGVSTTIGSVSNNRLTRNNENVKNSIDVIRENNAKFKKALTSKEWSKFNYASQKNNQANGVRIGDNGVLIQSDDNANSYKLVCYEEDDDYNLEIWSVYKLDNFDYNIHDDKENIAEIIVKMEVMGYGNRTAEGILQGYTQDDGLVLGKYSTKNSAFSKYNFRNIRDRGDSGQEFTGSGISQGTRKDRSFSLDVTLGNEKLKKANEYLRQEMKLTGHRNADIKACEAKARGLKKQLNSNIDTTVL